MAQEQGQEEFAKRYGQIVARAWADPAFKQRLLADPAAVLRDEGFNVPDGVEVKIMEFNRNAVYLGLPEKPSEDEISDEQLAEVAGGTGVPPQPWKLSSYLVGPQFYVGF